MVYSRIVFPCNHNLFSMEGMISMDKKEFALFAAALKTYYPRETLLPNNQAMELWFRQLQDIPYQVAEAALNKWVSTEKWSPSIADIRELSASIQHGELPDWGDSWERVCKAIRRYGSYNEKDAMESLDELTRDCVKRLGYLNLCMSENPMADRANYRMIYEQLAQRKKSETQLPGSLQKLIRSMREEPKRLEG